MENPDANAPPPAPRDERASPGRAGSRIPEPGEAGFIAQLLDVHLVRLVLGIALGLPVTALALLGAVYGLAMGYGGLAGGRNLGLSAIALGMVLLAFAGLVGAWRRILKPRAGMTPRQARTVRALLLAGVAAALFMVLAAVLWFDNYVLASVPLFIGAMGVVLLLATPAKPAAMPDPR